MIANKFKIRSETSGVMLTFDLNTMAPNSPYILKGITGLSAGDVMPMNYGSSFTGVPYYEMSLDKRDITLKIGLNPVYSTETGERLELRDSLYKAIYSARDPRIWFDIYNGQNYLATIGGLVTKLDASHFTAKPDVDLTIKCSDPYFKAPQRTTVDVSSWNLNTSPKFGVNYTNGSAPVGFRVSFQLNSPAESFGFLSGDDCWEFIVEHEFLSGDIIYFSSEYGEKNIYCYSPTLHSADFSGITRLADKLTSTAIWPILFPGQNEFEVLATPGVSSINIISLSYQAAFWGV
jgi:hypothetical protein